MLNLSALFILPKPAQLATLAAALITRYLFSDWQFLGYLLVFVCIGGVTGLLADYSTNKLSYKAFPRFWRKVFIYSILLIVAHGLTHFEIKEVVNWVFRMIDAVIYTLLMGREAVYILGNLAKIDPELIPATLRARLELAIMAVPNRIIDNLTTSPPERLPADKMDSPLPPDTAPVSLAEKTP